MPSPLMVPELHSMLLVLRYLTLRPSLEREYLSVKNVAVNTVVHCIAAVWSVMGCMCDGGPVRVYGAEDFVA